MGNDCIINKEKIKAIIDYLLVLISIYYRVVCLLHTCTGYPAFLFRKKSLNSKTPQYLNRAVNQMETVRKKGRLSLDIS